MKTYRQCVLQKQNLEQVSFIPSKFAVVGKVIKIKDSNDNWDDGWVVMYAGQEVDEKSVPDSHDAIKAHRKKTGDAMAKP